MYNTTLHSYTLEDAGGSYDWIVENMEPADCQDMTDADLRDWVAELINTAKELDIAEMEEWAKRDETKYPIFGYTTAQVFDTPEEYIQFKTEEIASDFEHEREYVFDWLKQWIASSD